MYLPLPLHHYQLFSHSVSYFKHILIELNKLHAQMGKVIDTGCVCISDVIVNTNSLMGSSDSLTIRSDNVVICSVAC